MAEVYTSTTVRNRGFGARMSDSCAGFCFGLLLILVSIPLLWWNEGNAVQQFAAVHEAKTALIEAGDKLEPALTGKLIYYTGDVAVPGSGASDPEFDIRTPGAIRVTRRSEAYLTVERSKSVTRKEGTNEVTDTTYWYEQEWSPSLVASSSFHDPRKRGVNPPRWAIPPATYVASDVRLGPYKLPTAVVQALGEDAPVDVTDAKVAPALAKAITGGEGGRRRAAITEGGEPVRVSTALVPAGKSLAVSSLTYHAGALYTSANALAPVVGDNRVTFTAAAPSTATVIGRQTKGGSIEPWESSNGRQILLWAEGGKTARQLLSQAEDEASTLMWALRMGGWVMMVAAFALLMQPALTLLGSVPLVGGLLSSIAGCGACLAATLGGTTVTLIVIAVAWLWARPLMSVGLLAVVALINVLPRLSGAGGAKEKAQ